MEVAIRCLVGPEIAARLDDVARLRITVFREFPYLYEGDERGERDYLRRYAESLGSVLVVAEIEGKVVGVSTGLPLADADGAFREPFEAAGMDVRDWFYLGESVLDPDWRGRGIGHRFFDAREACARELGFARTCFCAVVRPGDHPMKPRDYRPHDAFWSKRGYVRQTGLSARLSWPQVDSAGAEVGNVLVFWSRDSGSQM